MVLYTDVIDSDKYDLDLYPRDRKPIGFLLSASATYMWSFKVIWQLDNNCSLYRVHNEKRDGHAPTHLITKLHTDGYIAISIPTLLRGDKTRHGWILVQKGGRTGFPYDVF